MGKSDGSRSRGRVGIVTLPGNYNYGNRLQLFAEIRIYESLGYEPVSLVFRRRERPLAHPNRILRRMTGRTDPPDADSARPAGRAEAFGRFSRLIPERTYESLREIQTDSYAYFSVGSDQVWNPNGGMIGARDSLAKKVYHGIVDPGEARDATDWLFLGFADRGQRIALAPSIGADSVDARQARWLAEGVSRFDRLSVREERGAEIIRECSGREAEVVCDPTLALPRRVWAELADDRLTPEDPYVLVYLLGGPSAESEAALSAVTDGGAIPVIPLSDKSRRGEPDAGPAEFLSLVGHASHVVTDSFHASVFSAVFERPLTIVHRAGAGPMFSRLQALADTLGLRDKIYGDESIDLPRHASYEGVADAIARERGRFVGYLESVLDSR